MTNQTPNQKPPPTPARIAASRANGAKSHGPTTPEGHQKCAQAAAKANTKHGMLASAIVIDGESQAAFDELLADLSRNFNPKSRSENICIQKMAVAFWRQRRTWTIQQIDFNREMASQSVEGPPAYRASLAYDVLCEKNLLDKSHRYETTYDRQYDRALSTLERLQNLKRQRPQLPKVPPSVATSNWADPPEEQETKEEHEQPASEETSKVDHSDFAIRSQAPAPSQADAPKPRTPKEDQ